MSAPETLVWDSRDSTNLPNESTFTNLNNSGSEQPNTTTQEDKETDPNKSPNDDVTYNNRGYEVCGWLNQHNKPCQRIGKCPFHEDKKPNKGPKPPQDKSKQTKKSPFKQGWTREEHIRFLNGLQIHGRGAWKEIALIVGTRTATQIQSHAQKYYLRQTNQTKNKRSIHDITIEDLQEIGPQGILRATAASKHQHQHHHHQHSPSLPPVNTPRYITNVLPMHQSSPTSSYTAPEHLHFPSPVYYNSQRAVQQPSLVIHDHTSQYLPTPNMNMSSSSNRASTVQSMPVLQPPLNSFMLPPTQNNAQSTLITLPSPLHAIHSSMHSTTASTLLSSPNALVSPPQPQQLPYGNWYTHNPLPPSHYPSFLNPLHSAPDDRLATHPHTPYSRTESSDNDSTDGKEITATELDPEEMNRAKRTFTDIFGTEPRPTKLHKHSHDKPASSSDEEPEEESASYLVEDYFFKDKTKTS